MNHPSQFHPFSSYPQPDDPQLDEEPDDPQLDEVLDSKRLIYVESIIAVAQIITALPITISTKVQNPMYGWFVAYTCWCFVVPVALYLRFLNLSTQHGPEPPHTTDLENQLPTETTTSLKNQVAAASLAFRLNIFDRLKFRIKLVLDLYFYVWLAGGVWTLLCYYPSSTPHRLSRTFLFAFLEWVCCCFVSYGYIFISITNRILRAATRPTTRILRVKIRTKILAGTEKELFLSKKDVICCICLGEYEDNEELKKLSCHHVFHPECIDKWLKTRPMCPFMCEIAKFLVDSKSDRVLLEVVTINS